jgi:lipoprotein-anchoring transpeptidase ErfK/SrfK
MVPPGVQVFSWRPLIRASRGGLQLRKFPVPALLAALVAFLPLSAHAQGFEELVEDALERNAPGSDAPGDQPPTSAVPPRLGLQPQNLEPAPEPGPAPQAPAAQPSAAEGPRPYTPPKLAAPEADDPNSGEPASEGAAASDDPAVQTAEDPATPSGDPSAAAATAASGGEPQGGKGGAATGSLDADEVNAATYSDAAARKRGATPLMLKAQILLDRAGASPGVIDGVSGGNVAKAVAAVETVLGLPIDGQLDSQVWAALGGDAAPPVLIEYTITEEDASYPFLSAIPPDYIDQAELPNLNFTSPEEMFGERFHMDVELLTALNRGVDMSQPGNTIMVADIVGQPVTGKIARIEADKRARQVRAYDAQERLVVAYPATIGSAATPSPSGTHKVNTIAPEPVYYYNPDNFTTKKADRKLELPPGPNNPVGTMWIDLSQDGYGIHGTPEPSRIDKTASSGCIRLTNWDAEELATLVDPGITVAFVE